MPSTKPLLRIDQEVREKIEAEQRPRETYNDVLRRLLGIEKRQAKER